MTRKSWHFRAGLAALVTVLSAAACSSHQDKPGSLVSAGGSANYAGHAGASNAGTSNAGTSSEAGAHSGGSSTSEAGATGEAGASAQPMAAFQSELEVDLGCGGVMPDASFVIRNAGDEPLVISSASADSGYQVKSALPLQIAPGSGGTLLVAPPAPSGAEDAGAVTTGKLSFTTNEPGAPTHEVTLTSTLFAGSFEFTDESGSPIKTLMLAYDSGGSCPGLSKYRIHNTGNVAFTVLGPTFPAHFSGTNLGANGQAVPPDGYAELIVTGVSAPDAACSGTGDLAFSVMGVFCGAVPKLSVEWPQSTDPDAGASCACTLPAL